MIDDISEQILADQRYAELRKAITNLQRQLAVLGFVVALLLVIVLFG